MPSRVIWTIGHSTRPIQDFLALLQAHGIRHLVDVRTIPRSRHSPQFNTEALHRSLKLAGLGSVHAGELGGLRKPTKDSFNFGWKNASFRGYADYMQTTAFWNALDELMATGRERPTAIMCAEAVPWRCHRSLIADALLTRGCGVRHIMTPDRADEHRLTSFAKIEGSRLSYPAPADDDAPRLF
ncbi:MAG: DUF488 domain-containing protein [Nitrospiraceae bacterium]